MLFHKVLLLTLVLSSAFVARAGRDGNNQEPMRMQREGIRRHAPRNHDREEVRILSDDQDSSSDEAVMFVVQQTKYWRSISDPHTNYCPTYGVDSYRGAEIHNLRTKPCDTSNEDQLWIIVSPSDTHMRIQSNVKSNMCITMLAGEKPNTQPAQLMECGKFEEQGIELMSEGVGVGLMIGVVGGYVLRLYEYSCETNCTVPFLVLVRKQSGMY